MLQESQAASESSYTLVMYRAAGVVRGDGSLLRVVLPKASPPDLIHRFYAKPLGSALDSLKKDWESVSPEMWMVSKREIENAEAAPQRTCSQ